MKKLLSNTSKRQKHRHRHNLPKLTHLGTIITHNHFAPVILMQLRPEDILTLRKTHRLWLQLPLYRIILRCFSPVIGRSLQEQDHLKKESQLLRLHHHLYSDNITKLKKQLQTLETSSDFKNAQKQYKDAYTSFDKLVTQPQSLTTQHTRYLLTLYHILNSPEKQKEHLQFKAFATVHNTQIEQPSCNRQIEAYIDNYKKTEKEQLFNQIHQQPDTTEQQVLHTNQVNALLSQHPILVLSTNQSDFTPIHISAQNGQTNILLILLRNRADIHKANRYGNTPLHVAAQKGHKATVIQLLQSGANPLIKNKDSKTPSDLAKKRRFTEIATVLLETENNINETNNTPIQNNPPLRNKAA